MSRLQSVVIFGVCLCGVADFGCGGAPPPPSPQQWGEAAHGLAASLAAERLTFPAGQPVEVCYRIKNVSEKEQILWNCGFWPNHRLVMTDAAGVEVPLTEAGQLMQSAFDPTGPRRKNIPVRLAPAGIDAQLPKLDLRQLFKLESGTYRIRCLYHDGAVQVWSNSLRIECQ